MKHLILVICVMSVAAGAALYFAGAKGPSVSQVEPAGQSISGQPSDQQAPAEPVAKVERSGRAIGEPNDPVASPEASPARTAFSAPHNRLDSSLVDQAVDTLVSSQASHAQRQAVWKQLRETGRLDPAIAELERRTASEPRAAEYPAALGQAYLQKCAIIQDVREQGILAMQADKLFDNALNLDPSNWEARFTKAVALTYWPASMNKGDEIIQHFQTLIQQQETQSPQPQFAETYVLLGDQYQKAGQNDDARSVWARGAGLFPNDEKLSKKLASTQ